MYQPPAFREDRIEVQHALIRAHPLGLLITAGPTGLLANYFPFLIDTEGDKGRLRLHMARANPQWRELDAIEECLVVFQGPQDYVTPSWYATKRETGKVVPTWNYATVHVWGRPRVVNDDAWLRRQIEDLTASRESLREAPWAVGDAPAEFRRDADAGHRRRRDSDFAHRGQVEDEPEPSRCRSAGRDRRLSRNG